MNAMLGKSSANQFYFPNQLLSLINFITTIQVVANIYVKRKIRM